MRIVIVARTVMGSMRCLGCIAVQNNQAFLVRPIQSEAQPGWPAETDVHVGEVWEASLRRSTNIEPPHIEDYVCQFREYIHTLPPDDLLALVKEMRPIWQGGIGNLFDHHLRYTRSETPRAYIAGRGNVSQLPRGSVGFWQLPSALERFDYVEASGRQRTTYAYNGPYGRIYIAYVGEDPAIAIIPKGTIVRMSLARWWRPNDNPIMEERCYLQLSGWYGIEGEGGGKGSVSVIEEDDIPF